MKKIPLFLAIAAAILVTSCSSRLVDMTVASTKNMDLNNAKGYITSNNSRSCGSDTSHIVLWIPLGSPDIKEAMDQAIEKNGSNCVGLSNVTLTQKWWYVPLIYGQIKYEIEGDPVYIK